jgi:DUF438 domain-containing protein
MPEPSENADSQKQALRDVILAIHRGADREALRDRLSGLLARIPYHVVVEVEQRLIDEGLPVEDPGAVRRARRGARRPRGGPACLARRRPSRSETDRAILGRDARMCHPPHSVDVVERILSDFRGGREPRAAFWITVRGRFVHVEYHALRDPQGTYLGCLEVAQDLTEKRALTGEQRLLSYGR